MTRGDKIRLFLAGAASLTAMVWFAIREEFVATAGVAAISSVATYLTRRNR